MNSDNEINIKAGIDIDDVNNGLKDLEDSVGGLADAGAYLQQFDDAVKGLSDSFAESDPVFGKALETLGNLASGDYLGAIASGFEAAGAAMNEHTKYVESVNAAYEKLQTRIEPNGEFAKTLSALKGTLASSQAEGGSQEDIIRQQTDAIVEAKKRAAIREQSGDGIYGALAGWAGRNSGIVGAMGLNSGLDAQAQQDIEHRRATAQGDKDLAEFQKRKKEEEDAIEAQNKEMDRGQGRLDATQSKQDMENYEAGKRIDDKAQKEKERHDKEVAALEKELGRFDETDARKAMQKDRQDQLKALGEGGEGDKGFTSAIESFDQMYRRIQTSAAGTSDNDPGRKHREELAKKREELLEKFHKEDLESRAKEREKLVDDLAKKMGTV